MVEEAGAADLIAGERLQLGIRRGSPGQVIGGWSYFGYRPAQGRSEADMGRRRAEGLPRPVARRGDRRLYNGAGNRRRSDADA